MIVTLKLDGLHTLQRQAEELGALRAQVGLFPETAGRSADKGRIDNNPQLGAIHEFGLSYSVLSTGATIVIPARSWLRMPLAMHLTKAIHETGAETWFTKLHTLGPKRVLQFLGVKGEEIIQDAFESHGGGFWAKLRPRTIARKLARGKTTAILIESVQFRKAISSRVV